MKKIMIILITLWISSCIKTPKNKIVIGMMSSTFDSIVGEVSTYDEKSVNDSIIVQYYTKPNKLAKDLNNGKIDCAIAEYTSILKEEYLNNIKILFPISHSTYGLASRKEFNSIKDLNNSSVGVVENSIGETLIKKIKAENSISCNIKKYKTSNSASKSFKKGNINFVLLNFPSLNMLNLGEKNIYYFDKDTHYLSSVFMINNDNYIEKKKMIDRYATNVWHVTNNFYSNPHIAKVTIYKLFKVHAKYVEEAIKHLFFLPEITTKEKEEIKIILKNVRDNKNIKNLYIENLFTNQISKEE